MDVSVPKEPLRESYVNAVCTEPVVDITVRQALEIVADKYPDHPSFIFSHSDQELTNARLLKKVGNFIKLFILRDLCDKCHRDSLYFEDKFKIKHIFI